MRKYGFKIRTRGGMVVDKLMIPGRDQAEAERKLQQIYRHCEILEAKPVEQSLLELPRQPQADRWQVGDET